MASTLPKMVKENRAIIRKYGSGKAPIRVCCPAVRTSPTEAARRANRCRQFQGTKPNSFLIRMALLARQASRNRWTDTPSWPKDFTTGKPWMYSMAAPDSTSWARWPTGAVRALCRPMPRRAKADTGTPASATRAAGGQKMATHSRITATWI